jgi:hypothetical protein
MVLAASIGAAQTPAKTPACVDTAKALSAPPIYGVGATTIKNACPAFRNFAWADYRSLRQTVPANTPMTYGMLEQLLTRWYGPDVNAKPGPGPVPSPTPPTPTPTPSPTPPPQAGLYPNRPASFTKSSEIDFSQSPASLPDNVDRPIPGASGWNMIYFGSNWAKTSDGSWLGRWAPGSYGGGVIGSGSGHGIGNVFTYAANGTNRLYLSMRVYFDFDAANWHPISNKFVNLEGDRSLILMQLKEGGHWRHAEELANGGSFFVDGGRSAPGEAHIAGQIDNRPVPNRQWTQIEVLIDIPNRVYKIWQDGVLTTNATPTFASSKITTVGVYAFRGGGGETLKTELAYKYDHFFIAW